MRKQDIEKESFYTSPPYNYRPSIVEYLTIIKVTKNGIIADIMHLDRKRNLYIKEFLDDGLIIQLKDKKDLNDNELFLWDFLEKKSKNKIVEIKFRDLNKIVGKYEGEVISKSSKKFGSRFKFYPKRFWGFVIFGFLIQIIWSFINSMLNYVITPIIAILSLNSINLNNKSIYFIIFVLGLILTIIVLIQTIIIAFISIKKIYKSKIEKKYLFKEVILGLVKFQIIYVMFVAIVAVFLFIGAKIGGLFNINPASNIYLVILLFLLFIPFYYYYLGKVASRFLYWLFENKETEENRVRWLLFKDFIINNSEIEKKELKYYKMWDEFYYYALAVGAIKKPYNPI